MDEPTPIEPESDGTTAETGMDDLPDGLATTADGAAAAASGGLARRGLLVFGVFVIIVVGAIAFALAGGDDGDGDSAATESESEADADAQTDGDGDGTGDESTDGETSDDSTTSDGDAGADDSGDTSEEARGTYSIVDVAADEGMYYGGEAPIAWGDGFLSIRQEFVPSEVTFPELVPDLADRFPAEVADTLEAVHDWVQAHPNARRLVSTSRRPAASTTRSPRSTRPVSTTWSPRSSSKTRNCRRPTTRS